MYFELAVAYHQQGKLTDAQKMYLAALEQTPGNYYIWFNLGLLEIALGEFPSALQRFTRALQLRPTDAETMANLALCQERLGAFEQAAKSYLRTLELDPNNVQMLNHLAYCQSETGLNELALQTYDQAVLLAPQVADLRLNRGLLLSRLGRHNEALVSFESALALSPQDLNLLAQKGLVLIELMRYQEALEVCETITKRDAKHTQAWLARAMALHKLQRLNEALESYRQALKLRPGLLSAQQNIASIAISLASMDQQFEAPIKESEKSLALFISSEFSSQVAPKIHSTISYFRLKHDLQQAQFLQDQGLGDVHALELLKLSQTLLSKIENPSGQAQVPISERELKALNNYWSSPFVYTMPKISSPCLNLDLNWLDIEEAYLSSSPEIIHIDDFLAPEALQAFQNFSLYSKVWFKEYRQSYLGAFANQGFISPLHLQLAIDLRKAMPRVFKDYPLGQLWGFKYDAQLGKGINVHADFAKVNLNFWITPDHYNLNSENGGLKVYRFPAPVDWTFHDYNREPELIYQFLDKHDTSFVKVPYRANRAVLFNSALFHETDAINFVDAYQGRRINMTYLFGSQLA